MKELLKRNKGITLIALIITIIVLLLLAGVTMNAIKIGNIFGTTEKVVSQTQVEAKRQEIEEAIVSKMIKESNDIGLKDIMKELAKKEITTEGNYDSGTGQVKTEPDGYVYQITEENDNWKVEYIGNGEIERTINAETIVNDTSYYGAYVNYAVPSSGDTSVKWRIFYVSTANEEDDRVGHIYLIADDYIDISKTPNGGTNGTYMSSLPTNTNGAKDMIDEERTDKRIQKWQSKYLEQTTTSVLNNAKASAYIINSASWNSYYKNDYAEYAIGGATLELFIASYNKTHTAKPLYYKSSTTGYYVSFSSDEEKMDTKVAGLNRTELNNLYIIDASPDNNSDTRTR